ncbi:site-specific DNA-methyltransferase [Streptococcus pluranimalium]|uniref:site-specific DNA-methyltransferase n=1 Tax=Streptococcus hyovaginalis TaxID=149015 RepID=UPI003ABF7279
MNSVQQNKQVLISEIERRLEDKILEKTNAELLIKLINNAESLNEAINIAELGTTYKRTGLHFDKRLEKLTDTIKFFKKNEELSFVTDKDKKTHKLIIGDNYDALLNLLIEYRGRVDVIYIDPPYGKDSMGQYAETNYENALARDNLLSMLYPRFVLAKQLLSSNGVIFCSIDDKNQAFVKVLMDEIFDESNFLLSVPRQTKKGGKTTVTIANNHDYIIGYSKEKGVVFSREENSDLSKYKYEDKYVETRGKYALTQTLDYDSLSYGKSMDYKIEIDGQDFFPGGDEKAHLERLAGNHGVKDWTWRWSKSAVEWGLSEDALVVKNGRIYTKSYTKVRKRTGKNEWQEKTTSKAYTTLSYLDNRYSNDNGKKELSTIFKDGSKLFRNPKPTALISELIKMACDNENAIVLDFFAGSGTTGQAVLQLNKEDGGNRQFILATANEITESNPNGIVKDVTSRRLKRVMTGEDYDGDTDFKWIKDAKNNPLGDNLDVYEISSVSNFSTTEGKTPFDVIDEELYGQKSMSVTEKVKWICENFELTQKVVESDKEYIQRMRGE